jgi:hypothetical protein
MKLFYPRVFWMYRLVRFVTPWLDLACCVCRFRQTGTRLSTSAAVHEPRGDCLATGAKRTSRCAEQCQARRRGSQSAAAQLGLAEKHHIARHAASSRIPVPVSQRGPAMETLRQQQELELEARLLPTCPPWLQAAIAGDPSLLRQCFLCDPCT